MLEAGCTEIQMLGKKERKKESKEGREEGREDLQSRQSSVTGL